MTPRKPEPEHAFVPLAIVGIGALFPDAHGAGPFWANVQDGKDSIRPVPRDSHFDPADYLDDDPKARDRLYTARGGFLSPVDFDPLEFGITPNALEATDTSQLLGLVAAQEALRDAGYGPGTSFDRERASVILGVTGTLELVVPLGARLGHPVWRRALRDAGVEDALAERVVERISDSYVDWQEGSFPGLLGNVVAGRIANRLDLHGTNCVVDAACASSLSAIHLAALELATGRADLAVTGGIDTFNDVFMYMCFSKTPALSPTGDARPFAAGADGTILGEGLGVVVLKRLADAERDGDRVYATLRSMGSASDGKGKAIFAPSAAGQARALRRAYEMAGVSPRTIELVEAHGTGTRVGDAVEVSALTEVYREASATGRWCALGSVKSQIGHTKAAAGIAGVIKAALSLHHKVLPPTIKVALPLDAVVGGETPFYVNTEKRPWLANAEHPRRAAVSAFGFGGSNFHCVLEEHRAEKPGVDWDPAVDLLALSAAGPTELAARVDAFPRDLPWDALRRLAAEGRAAFDPLARCRLVLVLDRDRTNLPRLLDNAARQLRREPGARGWTTPDGACFGSGAPDGQTALLFPGQGSQYVGMLRDLACRFPSAQRALLEASRAYDDADRRLVDRAYPQPAFDDAARAAQEAALRDTHTAQPALGAASSGALAVLRGFGVRADALAGHSYGELVALQAAGCFDEAALHRLSALRGSLMADGGARGGMLAARGDAVRVRDAVRAEGLALVVANHNAPEQVVLSGAEDEIERACSVLSERGIQTKRLPVSAAFHSALVAHARGPMAEALRSVPFGPARVPVYANTTAEPYPDDADAARTLLAGQLANPVRFLEQIERMHAAGVRTFVEVGPGARLCGLVSSILGDRPHTAVAMDSSSGRRRGTYDLALALARLAALGHAVNLRRWNEGALPPVAADAPGGRPRLTIPICGANYVKPRPQTPSTPPVAAPPAAAPSPMKAAAPIQVRAPIQAPAPVAPATSQPADAVDALTATHAQIAALQHLQEQAADMHRRYLDTQQAAYATLRELMAEQRRLLGAAVTLPAAAPAAAPAAPLRALPAAAPPVAVAAVAAAPTPAPAPAPVEPVAAPPAHAVSDLLVEIVAEKTGFPSDMLELDMELDGDLGIDSIKRVEILAALQQRAPDLPTIPSEEIGGLRTLRQVIEYFPSAPIPAVAPPSIPSAIPSPITEPAAVAAAPAPPATAPAAPPVTATAAVSAACTGDVAATLIEIVAEKTGFPADMLELDMELDGDLGIDSIKRVEILSAVQNRLPALQSIPSEDMGSLRTLRAVCERLAGPSGAPAPAPAPETSASPPLEAPLTPPVTPPTATAPVAAAPARKPVELARSVPASVPLDGSPRPPVELPFGADVLVVGGEQAFSAAVVDALRLVGHAARAEAIGDAALPESLGGLVVLAEAGAGDDFLADVLELLARAGPVLRKTAGAFLATVSRLDGAFGLDEIDRAAEPLSAGLAGLLKTAAQEWSEVACKAIDVPRSLADARAMARRIVSETLLRGPLEVGLGPAGACTVDLVPAPLPDAASAAAAMPLAPGDLVVVSGGARGVTAECALALAAASQPTLLLLGRSPLPTAEPDWLVGARSEADVKRALAGRDGASPREVEAEYRRIAAGRELASNLDRLRAAGATVIYRALDIRDAAAVRDAVAAARTEAGPVRGVVHGAGVLADARIEDKTREQFERVYGTKVDGLRALLAAVGDDDLRLLALFSSTSGRFGRSGQADYAAANEVLNKFAQREARRRAGCRVVALGWGPWEGGMVTPALARLFRSEGIGLIPLHAGAALLVHEAAVATPGPAEVTVLATDPARVAPVEPPTPPRARPPSPRTGGEFVVALERRLDVVSHPFLASHVLGGRAVLPTAMMMEWFAHGALHANPGRRFHGIDGLSVLSGVKVIGDQPYRVRVLAARATDVEGGYEVPVELRGADEDGTERLHARARVLLVDRLPAAERARPAPALETYARTLDEVYGKLLFHGADFQGIRAVEGLATAGVVGMANAAPPPRRWIAAPLRAAWIADPLALDVAFQLLILWSRERRGANSLPTGAARYRQYRSAFPRDGVRISARITRDDPQLSVADVDFTDGDGGLVARMEGYEFVIDASLEDAFARRTIATRAGS